MSDPIVAAFVLLMAFLTGLAIGTEIGERCERKQLGFTKRLKEPDVT